MQKRSEKLLAKERSTNSSPGPPIKSSQSSPSSVCKELPLASPSPATADADTTMSDAPPAAVSHDETNAALGDDTESIASPIKLDSPDLRVHMPPVPAVASPVSATATTTPVSAKSSMQLPMSSTIPPSPLAPTEENGIGAAAAVSPVKEKKKQSIQDYLQKKKQKQAAAAAAKANTDSEHPTESTIQDDTQLSGTTNGDHKIHVEDNSTDLTATEANAVSAS